DPLARGNDLLQHLEVVRRLDPSTPPRRAPARQADVVRDLEQPRRLDLGDDAALQATERVHERRLDGVFGLLARAELVQAVAEDLRGVALVQIAGRVRAGGGGVLHPSGSAVLRNCCQPGSSYEAAGGPAA